MLCCAGDIGHSFHMIAYGECKVSVRRKGENGADTDVTVEVARMLPGMCSHTTNVCVLMISVWIVYTPVIMRLYALFCGAPGCTLPCILNWFQLTFVFTSMQ